LLLSTGLGAAVLAQTDDAYANKGDADKQAMKKNKAESQKTAQKQSTQQKAQYFNSWTEAEQPGQSFATYASSGLLLLDDALSSVVEDVRQQPIGGGPSGEEMSEQQKQQKEQQQQQALQQIEQNQQELAQVAKELRESAEIDQHPVKFHQAATSVADTFSSLQQARFANLESDVKKVQDTVGKLDVNKPLAAQSETIEQFFTNSSAVIEKMSSELEQSAVGGGPAESQQEKQQKKQQQKQQQQQQQQMQDAQ
jgi:hypothetical protein